jgi:exonuclease III
MKINGLRAHFEDLKYLVDETEATVISLQETNMRVGQPIVFGGYTCYSMAKEAEKALHGVAIMIKDGTKAETIHLKTSLNAIAAKIELKRMITVCSIYLPPNEKISAKKLTRLVTHYRSRTSSRKRIQPEMGRQ